MNKTFPMNENNVQPQSPAEMTNFCYSDAVLGLKLHLLKTYPPGAMIPMSLTPLPDSTPADAAPVQNQSVPMPPHSKGLSLNTPPPPISFENKAVKASLNQLFPEMGLQKFALIAKRSEQKDSEALLSAIRTKLAPCDLLILEELTPKTPLPYQAIFGTESTLATVSTQVEKVAYPEWSVLEMNKEAKKSLWSKLSEICRRPA